MNDTHSATPWEFTVFSKPDGAEIKTVADVTETVAHTTVKSGVAELWGVSVPLRGEDGAVLVVCYTGNGPTSKANAEFIARACNSHGGMLAALRMAREQYNGVEDMVPEVAGLLSVMDAAIAEAEGKV